MEQLALKLRREWGIDPYAPVDIFSLALEKIDNLTLQWLEMDQIVSGCCLKSDDDCLILINSGQSRGRQNFTLAHELYHLKFDESPESVVCKANSKDATELKANKFASYFLMPTFALDDYYNRSNIDEWTLKDMVKCEQLFQISHKALLNRLHEQEYLDDKSFEQFCDPTFSIKKYAANLGFDTSLYENSPESRKNYVLGNLIPLTEKLYEKDQIPKRLRDEIFLKNSRADLVYNTEGEDGFD